jgi:NADPH-dependent ferric siderophore reductase
VTPRHCPRSTRCSTPSPGRAKRRGGGIVTPSKVFLESAHDDDRELPVGTAEVTWVDRKKEGEALVEAVGASAFDAADHFGWVACDNRTTRAVAKIFREDYKIPRKSIKAQAYWVA